MFQRHLETTGHAQITQSDYAVRFGHLCRACRVAPGRFAANESETEYLCQSCWDLQWGTMEDMRATTAEPDDPAVFEGPI